MSGIRILSIKGGESYQRLIELGFFKVKECGSTDSFLMCLGLGYIEALILAQNTKYNNYVFVEPL
jgi:hypothetical protein